MSNIERDEQGNLPAFAWPGGYPVYYLAADNGVMCPKCANSADCRNAEPDDKQWRIVAGDVHWEGEPLACENCNAEIESAYGDPEEGGN
jgi:hypothetical protein